MKICRILFVALFAFPLPVLAASVTLNSNWWVLAVSDDEAVFDNRFQVGDNVSISTTFESSTPDVDPSAIRGQYDGAITRFTLTNGLSVFGGTGNIVINDRGPHGYLFGQRAAITSPSLIPKFSFDSNSDLAQQPSAALEWLVAAPPRIDSSAATLYFGPAAIVLVQDGNYKIADVPVPGALLLFNSAFAVLLVARRFARRG
jgi:hypothetical protein